MSKELFIPDRSATAPYAALVAESICEAVGAKDKEGRYIYLNAAMLHLLGVAALSDAIGKTDFEFFPDEMALARRDDEKRLIESKTEMMSKEEALIEPATGLLKWYQVTKAALRDEKKEIIGVVEIYRDITSRKESSEMLLRIQAELLRKEAAVSSLINNTDDYIWAVDREYNISVANEATKNFARAVLGIEVEIGMSCFSIVPPDDVELWNRYINLALSGECVVFETQVALPEGETRYEEATINPIKDFQGEIFGAAVFVRDITQRKRTEKELQRLNEELEKQLMEIQRAQVQLIQAEKMSSLGQMVAGLTHELNTPIGYLQNNIDLIKRRFENLTTVCARSLEAIAHINENRLEEALSKFQEISESDLATSDALTELSNRTQKLFNGCAIGLEQMSNLVQTMRNFSRLDEAEMKRANLIDGLKSVLMILEHLLREKEIQVELDFDDLPVMECYPAQLNQAFMNIIQNAIYAVESVKNRKIRISAKKSDDEFAVVEIQDNGTGIPKEIQSKIFDPFFTTKPVGKGTGLGLSTAYSVVKKHQGTIAFQTEQGLGTTFIVKIPIQDFASPK